MITHEEARKENNLMMENHVQLTKEKYDWCPLMVDRRKSHYKKIDDYITQQQAQEERAKKVEELLGLYLQRERLLNNRPKTKYQINIWKQRLKNNQYIQECLVKELEELK